jgi:phosphoribosylglycinamide formyltransferase 1
MRVGFLASHRGSSAQAIWTASKAGEIAVEPCVLICNNSGSDALSWARSVGLEAHHLSGQTHPDSDQLDAAITQVLDGEAVDVVVLSGYMKKLGPRTLRRFPNRILNIHPALLPHFGGHGMYGIRVHEAVIEANDADARWRLEGAAAGARDRRPPRPHPSSEARPCTPCLD